MATFNPISYTYVPTAPRYKSAVTHHKPPLDPSGTFNKILRTKQSQAEYSRFPAAVTTVAADDGGHDPGIRGTGTVHEGSGCQNGDVNDDDGYLPTIEELLFTKLQDQNFTTEDRGLDTTDLRVEEVPSEERAGSINDIGLAQSDTLGRSPDNPIDLLGDNDLTTSEAEIGDESRAQSTEPDASLFASPENIGNSTTATPPSCDGWHDIDNLPKAAQRLTCSEQRPSTSHCVRPHNPSSRGSSEPLHDYVSTAGHTGRAKSEATKSHPAGPRDQTPDYLAADRSVADQHELTHPALDSDIFGEEKLRQEDQYEDSRQPQQGVKTGAAAALISGMVGDNYLTGNEDRGPRLADPSPSSESSYDKDISHSEECNGDEIENNTESDGDAERPSPAPRKRKHPSSPYDVSTQKKRLRYSEKKSTRQHRPRSTDHRRSIKSHSSPKQGLRDAEVSSVKGGLPSLLLSAPQTIDTEMPSDYSNLGGLPSNTLPTLSEVTFRPQAPHCYSFTAFIRNGCDGQGVSFRQVLRLIESIGHVGEIDDITIKPIEHHSFLLTGFSRHSPLRLSGRTTASTAEIGHVRTGTTGTRPQDGRLVDAGALTTQNEPTISDDDSNLTNCDSESFRDHSDCSSGDEQGRPDTRKHSRWDELDEQRLLAYKKEEKPWEWIFKKFPGRTPAAIRTRWNMVRPRGE